MNVLYVIPARGGSKGIPGKNIKPLGGKPLITYAIDCARALTSDSHICVTTDDDAIIRLVENYGLPVPFIRPSELATDTAGTYEVLLHAISFYKRQGLQYDTIVLLQPTSPFRRTSHVQGALNLFTPEIDMVVSVKETSSNPYFVLFEENAEGFLKKSKEGYFTRRQDCPKVWEYNGAVYVINVNSLKNRPIHLFGKIRKFVMDELSSLDLDNPLDWEFAQLILDKQLNG